MSKPTKSMIRAANHALVEDIQTLESFAHARGLHVTAQALNRAKNALGWELSGDAVQASNAAFDRRPGEAERSHKGIETP